MRIAWILAVFAIGCSTQPPASPDREPQPEAHWSSTPTPTPAPTPTPTPTPTAAPIASTDLPAASASAAPAPTPLPDVRVANIGMHIGGGPNDDVTKAPIRQSVEPYFDDFRRCWASQDDTSKAIDFGVDLHIGKDGGIGKVDHPRTASKSKPFQSCVLAVFARVDFKKPKTGNTTVSYSLRFTPGK